ncbi:hypothetical protein [Massilia horti]|uniref:Uncharacterized protein n=1 Tax=Massilia horti TaxID=2562153 RepID=A0A4Y9T532_9BURK|nr:hypothetical protein [Massilia horti]TFW32222.1 hypothetical protein E4O92_10400 [Massilia horti]
MIVTTLDQPGAFRGAWLAENLARLRVRSGRKVLLLYARPEHAFLRLGLDRARPILPIRVASAATFGADLECFERGYRDVVIDAVVADSLLFRQAVIAAQIVVAACAQCDLAARLDEARMFNPCMQVLFTPAGSLEAAGLYQHIFGLYPCARFARSRGPRLLRRIVDIAIAARRHGFSR